MGRANDDPAQALSVGGVSAAAFVQSPTFDTLKIWIPWCAIVDHDRDAELPYGVRRIDMFPDCGARVEFSAKVLQERYPESLSALTIHDAFNGMNETGRLIVNPDLATELSTVERADRTTDLRLSQEPCSYVRSLRLPFHEGWTVHPYCGDDPVPRLDMARGVTLKHTVKFTEWISVYDKEREVRKHPVSGVDPQAFAGMVRVEYKVEHARNIRRRFGIPDASLPSLLASSVDPGAEWLSKWRGRHVPDRTSGTSRPAYFTALGLLAFHDRHEGDFQRMEIDMKRLGLRPDYWMPKVRAAVAEPETDPLAELVDVLRSPGTSFCELHAGERPLLHTPQSAT